METAKHDKDQELKRFYELFDLVFNKQIRLNSKRYKFNFQDREDLKQDAYIFFKENNHLDLESVLILFEKHIRTNYRYKLKEYPSGLELTDGETFTTEDLYQKYGIAIPKISRSVTDSFVLLSIFENRLLNQNFTLEQISLFCCVSIDKVFKLERRLKEEIRSIAEDTMR